MFLSIFVKNSSSDYQQYTSLVY